MSGASDITGTGDQQGAGFLQFAGTTVDGETSTVYPPLSQSDVRY